MKIDAQIKKDTDPIYQKVSKVIPPIEWAFHAPLIHKINMLKKQKNAVFPSQIPEDLQRIVGPLMAMLSPERKLE